MNFLVTGALGFIGSNFVNFYSKTYPTSKIIILDKYDYCSAIENIENPNIILKIGNIADIQLVESILYTEEINIIIHFAAESHVDNSFGNSLTFTENNIVGTHVLLEITRLYHEKTSAIQKFIHVSTDEVYGEVINDQVRTEHSLLDPTNPYAATKAAAEFIAKSYFYSYKLPIIITRANNVYGPNQYPEKVIPKFICQLLDGKPLTVHGNGTSKRCFIHIDDVCTAYDTIIKSGTIGEIYNISAADKNEHSVNEIADLLINLMQGDPSMITYVADRNFNDQRYFTSSEKLEKLGWLPIKTDFIANLIDLIAWYKTHRSRYDGSKLINLVDNFRTDKNTVHSYLPLYENLLKSKRETATNILEIGIYEGGSIKLWRDYFPHAMIHGIDIIDINEVWDDLKSDPQITLYTLTDAYDDVFINSLAEKKFDMILDDGPHTLDSMLIFVNEYSKLLSDDGILILEDIQSWDWIETIKQHVPVELKQFIQVYDLRPIKNRYDDIVFVINKNIVL